MGQMIGIDLGTTNTAVGAIVGGRPQMIKNKKGYTVFPSAVFIDSTGKIIVGRRAKTAMMTEPERGVFAVKRLLGRRFDSEEVTQIRKQVPYSIKGAPDGSCLVEMAGDWYTPIEIASFILKEARTIAEAETGETVDQAVITVPAYYNHSQRDATKQAATKAGLNCERIINEPTSAALAYGERKTGERIVLIFDLGGGTFDVSILHFSEGLVETLATKGDTFLGGEDFDERLLDLLADRFFNDHNRDPREDPVSRRRLKETAESAKCELSFRDKTSVLVPRLVGTTNLEHTLTRGDFEQIVDDLIQRAIQVTSEAVSDAGLRLQDINDLVLVGGQTRMPLIRQRISALLEIEPIYGVNPEEVVATGACVHGFSLVSESSSAPVLMDVTPFDLGVDIRGGFFEKIISRNSHVPTMETKSFSTGRVGQDTVRIVVRQGESRYAADNEFLGEFIMNNLMPNDLGVASVDVTLRLDANGMLHVSAVDPSTGERRNITARNYGQFVEDRNIKLDVESETIPGKRPQVPTDSPDSSSVSETGNDIPQDKKSKAKGGFFSRLFGKGKKESPQDISLSKAETAEPEIDDLSNALDTLDLDSLLPVGNEEEGQENISDDALFDNLASGDIQELDASALFDLDESELRDLGDEDFDDPSSKVAAIGMGDSSSSAQQSASNETRSDVQFTDQDDTQLVDAFNEAAAVESLLFDGLENVDQNTNSVPSPIIEEQDDDIDSILSSILDEPDEADTQIMDRSKIGEAVEGDDEDLERLLSELEKDVADSTSSKDLEGDAENHDLSSDVDELDIDIDFDFDFDTPAESSKPDSDTKQESDIDTLLSEIKEAEDVEVVKTAEIGSMESDVLDMPDIDDLLAELDIDIESISNANESEPEKSESQEIVDDIDSILSGDEDIDIDAFLQSLDIAEIEPSDISKATDLSSGKTEAVVAVEPQDFEGEGEGEGKIDDLQDDEAVFSDAGSAEEKQEKAVSDTDEATILNPEETGAKDASTANENSEIESGSRGDGKDVDSSMEEIVQAATMVDSKNVFESLPDDGFFSMFSDSNDAPEKSSESVSSDDALDDALEIPTSTDEDYDSLDDLFDD